MTVCGNNVSTFIHNTCLLRFRRHRHHKLLPGLHRYESRSGEDEWIAEAVFKGKRNGFYVDIGYVVVPAHGRCLDCRPSPLLLLPAPTQRPWFLVPVLVMG